MEHIEIGSGDWNLLKRTIVSEFKPGQLITHEWLWKAFCLKDFSNTKFEDYDKPADLIAAVKKADIEYLYLKRISRHYRMQHNCTNIL